LRQHANRSGHDRTPLLSASGLTGAPVGLAWHNAHGLRVERTLSSGIVGAMITALAAAMPKSPSLEDLITYAQRNQRVCPVPRRWKDLYDILNPALLDSGGARLNWTPAGPLILGGWWHTSSEDKRRRLQEHIEFAATRGLLEDVGRFLRSLPEAEWAHTWELNG
jgi:hypothetical protein